ALIPSFGMIGSATATLLSYGAMALTLGIYSKTIMHVPYRLPESFGLMVIFAALVFGEPIIVGWLSTGEIIGKMILFIIGLVVAGGYLLKLARFR
ncbi:MAG: hypothetical protein RI575_12730, partial [Balneolaceae bacterium]|nr:hypothetical protein [Balneolaceae bacterium]